MLDMPDNNFLEVAKEAELDYIISGNTLDFSFETFGYTKIVTPKVFYENWFARL